MPNKTQKRILVNNAVRFVFGHLKGEGAGSGTGTDRPITLEDWQTVFSANVVGYQNRNPVTRINVEVFFIFLRNLTRVSTNSAENFLVSDLNRVLFCQGGG